MRKLIILLFFVLAVNTGYSQLFSTGHTLKAGAMSVGFNPVYMEDSGFGMYFHGGYGLSKGMDLGLKLGFGHGTYVGADVEFGLLRSGPYLSGGLGAHVRGDVFGVDGTFLATFPISNIYLTTGLDMELDFYKKWDNNDTPGDTSDDKEVVDPRLPLWLPIGIEFYLKKHLSLIFEAEIPVSNSWLLVGGGLNIYF